MSRFQPAKTTCFWQAYVDLWALREVGLDIFTLAQGAGNVQMPAERRRDGLGEQAGTMGTMGI